MGQTFKVSVILTSFNHSKYLQEAINSILNQTFSNFELIILDDASSDNSWDLIKQCSDSRITAFRSNEYGEVVSQLNNAITNVAKGEYIAIHHSDDAWELDKLEKQVAFLDGNLEVGAVFTWVQIIDEHGEKVAGDWFNEENKTRGQRLNELFIEKNHLNHPSILIRKQCYEDVGTYLQGLAQTADAEMWSRVLIKFPIHILQERLTKHRRFSDKSNTSGDRLDVAIRVANEWNVIRKNFLLLNSFEDIVSVFPNLERFKKEKGLNHKFLLAMACLYECKHRNAWQLGLSWLFELINDPNSYQQIKMLYAFSYNDFIKLTAQFDVYSVAADKKNAERDSIIAERDSIIAEQLLQITELTTQLNSVYISRSWKLTRPLRYLIQLLQSR